MVGQFIKANAHIILTITGGLAIGAGSVLLIKEAKRVERVTLPGKEAIQKAREIEDDEARKKAVTKAYFKTAGEYVKNYAPGALLIIGGVACMGSATFIQSRRLKAISAAYTSLAAAYGTYREKVKKLLGAEEEEKLLHGDVVTDEDGKPQIVAHKEETVDGAPWESNEPYEYLMCNENFGSWNADPRVTLAEIAGVEGTVNAILRERGWISLNEVLQRLSYRFDKSAGKQRTFDGQILGWIWNERDHADTYVDLHACLPKYDEENEALRKQWKPEWYINLTPPDTLVSIGVTDAIPHDIKEAFRKIASFRKGAANLAPAGGAL
mgnify:CR=1 FL=1